MTILVQRVGCSRRFGARATMIHLSQFLTTEYRTAVSDGHVEDIQPGQLPDPNLISTEI